jgi:prevent-host-death family protein
MSIMAKPHTVHAAKTQLSRLIERAERGEEVIIARGSEAVVKLVPVGEQVGRRFGAMRGRARVTPAFFEPLPVDELNAWGE